MGENNDYGKVTSFRIPSALHAEFKQKAQSQGRSMNEVIKDMIRNYVGIKTNIDELKQEKKDLVDKKAHIEAKVSEIERAIEDKKGEIPDEYKEYLENDFQDQDATIQEKRIREFSRRLDMNPEKFISKARREVENFEF